MDGRQKQLSDLSSSAPPTVTHSVAPVNSVASVTPEVMEESVSCEQVSFTEVTTVTTSVRSILGVVVMW